MSVYCPYCGAKLPDNSQFCNICGKKMPVLEKIANSEVTPSENLFEHVDAKSSEIEPQISNPTTYEKEKIYDNYSKYDDTKRGKSIASFVFGLLAVVVLVIPYVSYGSFILATIGIVYGLEASGEKVGIKGLVIAGIILSVFALIARVTMIIVNFLT